MNYRLYIGLDVQNGQSWNRQDAVNVIISVCRSKGVTALSISDCQGVYTYDDGETVQESTLVLLLVNINIDIKELVQALKSALKQECIMLEKIKSGFDFV